MKKFLYRGNVNQKTVNKMPGNAQHDVDPIALAARDAGLSRANSTALNERARRVIWKGGKESTQHEALRACGLTRFVSRGSGYRVWDVDNNYYVDYLMSWGTVLLGHAYPDVERAVSEQLARGSSLNLAI